MSAEPYFVTVGSWEEAAAMLSFSPLRPQRTAGHELDSLSIHVRDHKRRELGVESRTLEAHYGAFVVSQSRPGESKARRQALSTMYGAAAADARVAGHEGRLYELGPDVPPDDIDGRAPAVVTWHDDGMLFLIASGSMAAMELLDIAQSMYASHDPA